MRRLSVASSCLTGSEAVALAHRVKDERMRSDGFGLLR